MVPIIATALITALSATTLVLAQTNNTSPPSCVPHAVTPSQQSALFASFVQQFYVIRNPSRAFELYIMDSYIQHNAYEPPFGPSGSVAYLTPIFTNFSIEVTLLRQSFSNGLGWVHSRYDNIPGYPRPVAIADIFEFTDSCIKEHWDVVQELPADATNPLALF